MKILNHRFKPLIIMLAITMSLLSCSKDDSSDTIEDLREGHATAVIEVNQQTVSFAANSDRSFATIVTSKLGENDIRQLVVVMADEKSDAIIVSQAAPAPNNPINYDLSKVGFGDDYFFTTSVAMNGKNSSDANIYGMGSIQQDESIVLQSSGSFKITAITTTHIKGTFEMTLYNSYDPDNAEKLSVTKGAFDLPLVELDEDDLGDLGID